MAHRPHLNNRTTAVSVTGWASWGCGCVLEWALDGTVANGRGGGVAAPGRAVTG
jgi:hypothetical protein